MMADLALVALGVGLCAGGIVIWEWLASRPRLSRTAGAYRDARKPFSIVAQGQAHGPERSDDLIAREARRMMRGRTVRHSSGFPSPNEAGSQR